ncbi:hypothetical protein PR048_032020 [Dryococelus australis]|uniref:Uncharacterized protein n=1 Tax=Dryococelus australis TaxID=614101 RepID=A0ABQ9G9L2_9NEOP|nr:hypothetical protein PR048_032020 [Dryococelus australis]
MRVLKTKGGLTRGRGIIESTLAYFVAAFLVCMKLCNALEELSGTKAGSSEHYELSPRPPALFDEVVMRKTVKSAVLHLFSYTTPEENPTNDPRIIGKFKKRSGRAKIVSFPVVQLLVEPPTSAACAEHSLRAYYQGWKLAGGFLVPILTSQAPAPESLLSLVSCGCKTDRGYRYECRRAGLACSTMCGHCRGGSCMNIKVQYFHGSDNEDDPEEATL